MVIRHAHSKKHWVIFGFPIVGLKILGDSVGKLITFIGLLGYFCNKLGCLSGYFSCRPVPLLTGERLIEVNNNNTYSTKNVHVLYNIQYVGQ